MSEFNANLAILILMTLNPNSTTVSHTDVYGPMTQTECARWEVYFAGRDQLLAACRKL